MYIIDFGLAKKFRDSAHQHIPYRYFCGINSFLILFSMVAQFNFKLFTIDIFPIMLSYFVKSIIMENPISGIWMLCYHELFMWIADYYYLVGGEFSRNRKSRKINIIESCKTNFELCAGNFPGFTFLALILFSSL